MAEISLDFQFKSSIDKVWDALTNSETLAKWVMENNFKPVVGHKCQFWNKEIDLIVDCEVLIVDKLLHMGRRTNRHDRHMDVKTRRRYYVFTFRTHWLRSRRSGIPWGKVRLGIQG